MGHKVDKAGNTYYNVRITILQRTWDEHPGIRLQAYREDGGLNQGPQIPIPDKTAGFDLIRSFVQAICEAEAVERTEG